MANRLFILLIKLALGKTKTQNKEEFGDFDIYVAYLSRCSLNFLGSEEGRKKAGSISPVLSKMGVAQEKSMPGAESENTSTTDERSQDINKWRPELEEQSQRTHRLGQIAQGHEKTRHPT